MKSTVHEALNYSSLLDPMYKHCSMVPTHASLLPAWKKNYIAALKIYYAWIEDFAIQLILNSTTFEGITQLILIVHLHFVK